LSIFTYFPTQNPSAYYLTGYTYTSMEETQNLAWEAPSHEHTERSTDWYWALGVLALSASIVSLLLHNPLFAVIIVLGSLSLGIIASRKPENYPVEIDPQGITMGDNLYLYRSLESFWIDTETRDFPHLIVASRSILVPQLIVPIANVDARNVRDFLLNYLPEKEQYESPFTRVAEIFGF